MTDDSSATWQSILTTFLATALVGGFTLFTYNTTDPVIWIALGAASVLTAGLFVWAGFFYFALPLVRSITYVGLLKGLGFSILGLAIPILALTFVRSATPGRWPETLWTRTNLFEVAWVFGMQVQALRELVGASYVRAIGMIVLGLTLAAGVAVVVFYATFRVY
jgi:hypothetical protein